MTVGQEMIIILAFTYKGTQLKKRKKKNNKKKQPATFTNYGMLREVTEEGDMRGAVKEQNKETIRAEKRAVANSKPSKTGSKREKMRQCESSVHNNVHNTQVYI